MFLKSFSNFYKFIQIKKKGTYNRFEKIREISYLIEIYFLKNLHLGQIGDLIINKYPKKILHEINAIDKTKEHLQFTKKFLSHGTTNIIEIGRRLFSDVTICVSILMIW